MDKNKGFTLIELLGILVVLSIMVLVGVPSITKLIKSSKEIEYKEYKRDLEFSAEQYVNDNLDSLTELNKPNGQAYVRIEKLKEEGYIKSCPTDPRDNTNPCDATNPIVIKIYRNSDNTLGYSLMDQKDLPSIAIESISITPTSEWTNKDVTVTVDKILKPSGVELHNQAYSFDGGLTWQAENKKTFSTNVGEIKIIVRTENGTHTPDSERILNISNIDKIKPSSGAPTLASNTRSITVTQNCLDNGSPKSGVGKYNYILYNSSGQKITESGYVANQTYKFDKLNHNTMYQIGVVCKDNAGNKSDESAKLSKKTTQITPPTCTIENSTTWTKTKTIKVSYPNISGITNYYKLTTGKISGVTKNVDVESDALEKSLVIGPESGGTTGDVEIKSSDGYNSVTNTCSASKLDQESPTCTVSGNGSSSSAWAPSRSVTATCNDGNGSGCSKSTYSETFTTSGEVSSKSIKMTDTAGNTSECTFDVYKIDSIAPTCGTATQNSTSWGIINSDSRYYTINCNDTGGSGCASASYKTNSAKSNTSVSTTIYDNAGNSKTCSATIKNLERQVSVSGTTCTSSISSAGSNCYTTFNTDNGIALKHVYWQIYNTSTVMQGGYNIWAFDYANGVTYGSKYVRLHVYTNSAHNVVYFDCSTAYCQGKSIVNTYIVACSVNNHSNCTGEVGPYALY